MIVESYQYLISFKSGLNGWSPMVETISGAQIWVLYTKMNALTAGSKYNQVCIALSIIISKYKYIFYKFLF